MATIFIVTLVMAVVISASLLLILIMHIRRYNKTEKDLSNFNDGAESLNDRKFFQDKTYKGAA